MKVSAIIVAAGSSRRMGFDKLEADLEGRSVLHRSLLAFQSCDDVAEILVVTSPEKREAAMEAAKLLSLSKFAGAVEGGAERHLSVSAGILEAAEDSDLIAVHDAARPLVTPEAVSRCAAKARETGAATLAHRVVDTLKRGNGRNEVVDSVSRDHLWAMETPQIFAAHVLRDAYEKVLEDGALVTDEVSAVEALGQPVTLVENLEPNFKITVPGDIEIARRLFQAK